MTTQSSTKKTTSQEISITRTFRAPPERVFDAFTDPAKLAKWWGPDGWRTDTKEFDPRPGGLWRHTMRGPAGEAFPNEDRFVEVERPRRLVIDHVSAPRHRKTITLEPTGAGGTRMRFHMAFPEVEDFRMATETFGAIEGQKQTAERLADFVDGPGFTLVREFRAAPEKVWRMWTTPDGIMKWWAPSAREMGYDFRVLEMDVRVDGHYRYSMVGNGHDLVNRGTYTSVEPNVELAMLWHFDIFLPPGESPYDIPIRVAFARTPAGGTRMTFREGSMKKPEHTNGSRQGVEQNFRYLAEALEESS
jgi:uncharacterized protein YndB with AHSA1/START domain